MNLLKVFEFKGIFQAGKRMAIPPGYFRRFTNAYKDKTGRIIPFGKGLGGGNQPSSALTSELVVWDSPVLSAVFKGGIFQLIKGTHSFSANKVGAAKYYQTTLGDMDISQVKNGVDATNTLMNLNASNAYCPAGNFSHAVVNNKLFFSEYVNSSEYTLGNQSITQNTPVFNLMKFDGINIQRAGLPTPWYSNTPNAAGTTRVRTVYMTLGLDGEVCFSNYLEYGITPNGSGLIPWEAGGYDGAFAKRPDPVGMAGCYFPTSRYANDSIFPFNVNGVTRANYYNTKYIAMRNNSFLIAGGTELQGTINYCSPGLQVGDWVMCIPGTKSALSGSQELAHIYDAYYMKITTIDPNGTDNTQVGFSLKIKGFNGYTASWEDIDLAVAPPTGFPSMSFFLVELESTNFANMWQVVSNSANAGGTLPFLVSNLVPVFQDSHTTLNLSVAPKTFYRPLLGIITSEFLDWYDPTIVKTTFPPVVGVTSYQGLLVGFDKNALYFNDTSLGGSTEMVSGISNLIPYGSEYGDIVAICGSENFLLISRERKNFVLTGELTTGNVNISEIDQPVPGAANARAVSNAFSDKIIMMNKIGIYSISSNAGITDISKEIKDLFIGNPQDGNLFDKTIFKTKQQKIVDGFDGSIFKIALEESRGFILFLTGKLDPATKALTSSNILVYDTNDGSWYEFTGNNSTTIESLFGTIYNLGFLFTAEDGQLRTEGQLLATTYIQNGEPSLEKQLTQIKLYGTFANRPATTNTSGIKVRHQNDWKPLAGSPVYDTDVDYVPGSTSQYTHKKRLNSSKPQCFSIILQDTDGGGISLEGMEIEFTPVQEGVKK